MTCDDYLKLLMALTVLLAGCLVGPDFERPETDLPASYLPGTLANGTTNAVTDAVWWQSFDDPVLATLIDAGLEGNLGVQQAIQRVRASRAGFFASGPDPLRGRRQNRFGHPNAPGEGSSGVTNSGSIYSRNGKGSCANGIRAVPKEHLRRSHAFFKSDDGIGRVLPGGRVVCETGGEAVFSC